MSAFNWKFILRPIGVFSIISLSSGLALMFKPALISSSLFLLVWLHAEWDWWRSGETNKDISKLKN
ncbi:hypothetical protein, partial [Serratia marcescens]|uniref:hypothetical protein n=1 Tax=Serratia marcescens TaxID=615 RepID=UPI00195531CD